MILLLLLILLSLFSTLHGIQNIECGSSFSSNIISNGDYAFFRSPNFPKTLSNGTTQTVYCRAQFQTTSGNFLWLAMYNGVTNGIAFDGSSSAHVDFPSYNSNYDVLTSSTTLSYSYFQLSQTGNPLWTAFESVILSYNPSLNSCPFAQKNITLDSNVIIPIASDFGPEKIEANCDWTFVIGPGQQLKVVIKKQKIGSNFAFTLTTDGKNIANFNSAVTPDDPKIYYFDSTSGIFQFNMNNANSTNANFLAFISKVDKIAPSNSICKNETVSSNYVTVSNINYQTGYSALNNCEYKLSIPTTKELLLHVDNLFVEKNADTLIMKNSSYQSELNEVSYYHLMHNYDTSIVRFSSDGNTQQAGFSLHYNIIDCNCADSSFVVPCTGGTIFPTTKDHLYCSNSKCNYTIVKGSCPYDHFILKLNLKLRDSLDYINVYLNGKLNENDNGNGITDFENSWSIDVSYGLTAPNVVSAHNLTTLSPTYVIWLDDMHFNDAVIVCAPTGNTLEMFLSSYSCSKDLSNYGLYDSQSLENYVINLDSSGFCSGNTQNLPSKVSASGCFTLYSLNATSAVNTTVLFRLKEVHSKNCVGSNVLQVFESQNSSFSISSTSSGSCELTILSAVTSTEIFGIEIYEFASSPNALYTFKSPINQNKVFDLKSSEIFYYLPLNFYTPALSILISSGKSFSFTATSFTYQITVTSAKATIAPPSYYGFAKNFGTYLYYIDPLQIYGAYNSFNFVVKQLNAKWQVQVSGYYFKSNDNVTLRSYYDSLQVTTMDVHTIGFLIDFSVIIFPGSTVVPTLAAQTSTIPTKWPTFPYTSTVTRSSVSYQPYQLICITDNGHKRCLSYDYYCVYLDGTYNGTHVKFQGCSLDLNQEVGKTVCTANEFTHGSTNGNTYTLQCCDTNNCNTGKEGSIGGPGTSTPYPFTLPPNNELICLTTSGHKTCLFNDFYCAYLEGTYGGGYTKFQGCSLDLAQTVGTIVCTMDEFTDGTTGDDKYTLQCCDTNNCNTGKNSNSGNDGTGGNSNRIHLNFEFTSLLILLNYIVFKLLL